MNSFIRILVLVAIVAAVAGGVFYWRQQQLAAELPVGIVKGNGRIEAVQVDIATKVPGRVQSVSVNEGDMVDRNQVLATMDDQDLKASILKAKAIKAESEQSVAKAKLDVVRYESDLKLSEQQLSRTEKLVQQKAATASELDQRTAARDTASAALESAKAAIRTQEYAVTSAQAEVNRLEVQLKDAVLTSPARGRVLYRLAEDSEVLPAGGKVLTLLDLTDVYMEIFLPAADAARVTIGSDARVVFDAAPDYAAHAKVTFVSPEAQFTPKEVETFSERESLMFRVKVQLPPERVALFVDKIKTGLRGVAYIRLDETVPWPEKLERRFPDPVTENAGTTE